MFSTQLDLTSGSRPILQQDETLLFVQNGVGLYEGKYKIVNYQNGHAYLTSHRACYIDDIEPRTSSVAINLKDVERHEYQAGFLRSSAKVTFHSKPPRRGLGSLSHQGPSSPTVSRLSGSFSSPVTRSASPLRPAVAVIPLYSGNWTCAICSFSNAVPSNFDPANEHFPLQPCLTCGIQPEFSTVLRAAISAGVSRTGGTNTHATSLNTGTESTSTNPAQVDDNNGKRVACPTCTFLNDRYLHNCEICNTALPQRSSIARPNLLPSQSLDDRSGSPSSEISSLSLSTDKDETPSIKFSFRAGGDKIFYERLKSAMIQRKWLVKNAPSIPRPLDNILQPDGSVVGSGSSTPDRGSTPRPNGVGIAGLEARGLATRRNNEVVLGTAFEDLEALMASARDVVALAEKFALETQNQESGGSGALSGSVDPLLYESAAAVGMVATKDMLSGSGSNLTSSQQNKLYITELSRNLAEYVTDTRRSILQKQGGVMSLVDLWATFNRSRNGVELISPTDFHKAAETWSTLNLPLRLRSFKSGLLVVQNRDRSDDKTINQLKAWLQRLQREPPSMLSNNVHDNVTWDWTIFGYGVTAQDAAREFGWSLGVATEELEMAEEKGALCREEGIQGLKFWLNHISFD